MCPPYPREGENPETQNEFISRCAGSKEMNRKHPDDKQRVAICYSLWREAKKPKKKK